VIRLMVLPALWAARIAQWLSKMMGKGKGSSLPGMVALKIYPGILRWFARQPRRGVVMVTGTNGKTTTNNMLAQIMGSGGSKVLANREGANLITGITTAFLRFSNLWGEIDCDYAVLEVDEAAFPAVSKQVSPGTVLVTNFFRDQLDRYGELDTTINMVARALAQMPGTGLVLNADDPLVAQLEKKTALDTIFYGLDTAGDSITVGAETREAKFCPLCGASLAYSTYNYSQLGDFNCPGCGFRRPRPFFRAAGISRRGDFFRGSIHYPGGEFELSVPARGMYNFYNALAAVSAAHALGKDPAEAAEELRNYVPATGRMDYFQYQGKPVMLNLVKNPTGFNQALATLLEREDVLDVLIAINDNAADGRDISWLWDVDFEVLEDNLHRFRNFICTGKRAEEIAVRLKYAGVDPAKIIVLGSMEEAVQTVITGGGGAAFLLATYTALWPVEAILAKKAKRVEDYAQSMSSVS